MPERIDQIYATHCTYGTSAIERREGELADRLLGYSARASSLAQADLPKYYREIERYLYYYLPHDTPAEDRRQHTETTAPKRLVFIPSIRLPTAGELQVIAHVCYRPKDVANRPESYFAHILLRTVSDQGSRWSAMDCARLWNCPSWVETDDSSITHHLPPKSSLHDFAGGVTSCIDDDTVHRFFTQRSFFPEKLASDPRTRERWVAIGESKRQTLLANALHAFLEVAEQPNQSLVFVIEPEVAVLFFYTLARLVPARIARASHSFSTFESHVERLTTTLAATCFCDNERSDLAAEHYHRGHVLNSFKTRPADWQPRQSGYAANTVRLLVEGSWKAVDRCLAEYDGAGATSVKHLHDLDRARELAEGMFDTTAPPGNVAGLPALARRFMAAHIRQAVNDDDGSRLAALHKSEPHAFALLRLIPDLLGHPGGEKARETLLGHVPEPMFPGLLNLDIPVADKVTALAMFARRRGRLPANLPDIWGDAVARPVPRSTSGRDDLAVALLQELPPHLVKAVREKVGPESSVAFAAVLAQACGKADYQKGEQLHLAVSGLASDEQQCLEFVGLLGSQVERIPPHTRDVLARNLHEVIRTLPRKPEEILAKLQVLSGASAILHERYANRLNSWLEVKRLLEPEESVPAPRWIPFGSRRTTALQRQKTLGPKLAEAISGVAGPESPNRRNVQHHISEAVDGVYALAAALQCNDDLLPDRGKLEELIHNVLYPPASKRLLPRQLIKHKQVRKSAGQPGRPVPWFALLMLFVCTLVLACGAAVIVIVLGWGFRAAQDSPVEQVQAGDVTLRSNDDNPQNTSPSRRPPAPPGLEQSASSDPIAIDSPSPTSERAAGEGAQDATVPVTAPPGDTRPAAENEPTTPDTQQPGMATNNSSASQNAQGSTDGGKPDEEATPPDNTDMEGSESTAKVVPHKAQLPEKGLPKSTEDLPKSTQQASKTLTFALMSFKTTHGTPKTTIKPENGSDTSVAELRKIEKIITADQLGGNSHQNVLKLESADENNNTTWKIKRGKLDLASIRRDNNRVSLVVNRNLMKDELLQLLRCAVLKVDTSQGVRYVSLGASQSLSKRSYSRDALLKELMLPANTQLYCEVKNEYEEIPQSDDAPEFDLTKVYACCRDGEVRVFVNIGSVILGNFK